MKILSLLLISAALFGSHIAIAAPGIETEIETKLLNPLRFTNRSQCAIDSENPTSSVFLMIDGFNAGKVGNSLAKLANMENPDQYANLAMKQFRLAATYMTVNIMNKMIQGQLPLLPTNSDKTQLKGYAAAVAKCGESINCPEMNAYISKIWKSAGDKAAIQNVDNFTQDDYPQHTTKDRLGCYYIKRFSALQAPLHQTAATQASLASVALAYMESKDYITGCFDSSDKLDNRYATIQIDWETNKDFLKNRGFDFWNSLKIYLSWSWRHSEEVAKMSPAFSQIFRSIGFEEAILLTPNGCKSMAPPSCDSEYLAQNSIRELAKIQGVSKEHFQNVPATPDRAMQEKGVRGINNDFLGTQATLNAQDWLKNFRTNLGHSRNVMKTKYQAAVQNLNLVMDNLGSAKIVAGVKATTGDIKTAGSDQLTNELYYLCTELRLTGNDQLDFLKTDIERIGQLKTMSRMDNNDRRSVKEFVDFFKEISSQLMPLCEDLEKVQYWNRGQYIVNRSGLAGWATEMLSFKPNPEDAKFVVLPEKDGPLLSWANPTVKAQTICSNAIDCTRLVMKSMVDLYAVATYADALMPLTGTAGSPNLFNPYSEISTCKMYDPWFATKRMNKNFLADLANTALFGWNFLPLYVDANVTLPTVSSFNQLVDDGVIKFDARINKEKMQKTIVSDFGPLTGAPCAVAVDRQGVGAIQFFSFTGITVNSCTAKKGPEVNFSNNPNDFTITPAVGKSVCGGCTINLQSVGATTVATSAVGALNPGKFFLSLFRMFSKLHEAKLDDVNLPITANVNPAFAAEVYKKYGEVPAQCVDQLGRGLRCFHSTCSATVASEFENKFGTKVNDIYLKDDTGGGAQNEAWIKSELCDGDIIVPASCTRGRDGSYKPYIGTPRGTTPACRKAIGR